MLYGCAGHSPIVSQLQIHPFMLCSVMLGLRSVNHISALPAAPFKLCQWGHNRETRWLKLGEETGPFFFACSSYHLGSGSCSSLELLLALPEPS